MPHPAYILSGGRSRRFGSDKARYVTPAGPQLLALLDQLRTAGHAVYVVADRADRYIDFGITCLVDVQPESGPLSGLASALGHHRHTIGPFADRGLGWLLLVSCDQRNWQTSWYEQLVERTKDRSVDDLVASVFFDTMWQPLPGLYHSDLLSMAMDQLQVGQLSLHGLLNSVEQQVVKVHTTQPPAQWSFNTLAELD